MTEEEFQYFVRKQLYLLWIVCLCNTVAIGLL